MVLDEVRRFINNEWGRKNESAEAQRSPEEVHEELARELRALDSEFANNEHIPQTVQSNIRIMQGDGARILNNLNAFLGAVSNSRELRKSLQEALRFLPQLKATRSSIAEYLPKKEGEERSL